VQKKKWKAAGKSDKSTVRGKVSHGDWCKLNFISGKSLSRAYDIRKQIEDICSRSSARHGLGWDAEISCGTELEAFLKCICAGLFLKVAIRIPSKETLCDSNVRKRSDLFTPRGRYRTKIGSQEVFIHPSSAMFARNPAPRAVVFTELIVTKKTYIRGITQIRESWLPDVAPALFEQS
jgi:hypothetical protein